jgi:hypothetical protein
MSRLFTDGKELAVPFPPGSGPRVRAKKSRHFAGIF